MIVYKVVIPYDDMYFSSICIGKAVVRYKPGKFVQAPQWLAKHGYHCCVFRTYSQALSFTGPDEEVWAARATGVRGPRKRRMALSEIKESGQLREASSYSGHARIWPPGTLFAKNVKLLAKLA